VRFPNRLLGAGGIVLVLAGVFLAPLVLTGNLAILVSQFLIVVGWFGLVLAAGSLVLRLTRPALLVSAGISALVGFAVIFGIPLLGPDVPRTVGLVAVLLALLSVGWLLTRGLGMPTVILAGALAGIAALSQITASVAGALGVSTAADPFSGPANAARWTTLSLCALVVLIVAFRRDPTGSL
jgi:hypothetical protein